VLAGVAAAFADDARRKRLRVCYFGAQSRLAAIFAETGRAGQLLLGAQPIWDPQHWPSIFERKSSLRAQVARARNKGVQVQEWPAERATDNPGLLVCLKDWLSTRGLPPMHFLVEPVTLGRLHDRRVFVATRGQGVVGFLVASPIPLREGWLVEQIVRSPEAPNGVAELMVDTAIRTVAADGSHYVTLGLAPLSRRARDDAHSPRPWIRLLLHWMRLHGRRFYNFDGLDAFKAKLQPQEWEPVYALTRERSVGLRTLYAIAGAFGGRSPIVFVSRALLRAARQELDWVLGS
jgi:phosphatidylglycerol lysyltransferase